MATPIPSTAMAEEIPNAQQANDDADVTLALLAARTADAKKGTDIIVLEVGEVLAIAGYFVVCSASNPRLVRSIADDIERAVKQELGRPPMRQEGRAEQQWILIDYGDVIVHVFHEEQREFYEIERLYLDVPRIDWAV
jgi:ribosome-associated protein